MMQKSKYPNIYWSDKYHKWYGKFTHKGTLYNFGTHPTERECAIAHDKIAIKLGLDTYILKKKE